MTSHPPAVLRSVDLIGAGAFGRALIPAAQHSLDQRGAARLGVPLRTLVRGAHARYGLSVDVDWAGLQRVDRGCSAPVCGEPSVDVHTVAVLSGAEIDRAARVVSARHEQDSSGKGGQSCHFTRIIDPIPADRNGLVREPRFAQ